MAFKQYERERVRERVRVRVREMWGQHTVLQWLYYYSVALDDAGTLLQ